MAVNKKVMGWWIQWNPALTSAAPFATFDKSLSNKGPASCLVKLLLGTNFTAKGKRRKFEWGQMLVVDAFCLCAGG
ncbi:hypothetical protein LSTR_LSTR017269 [Laodelphax striatellus]|uniref:Uncharacterized protein n=2 Tax=Laodelphax striatellus TaxID=195883 RepID=A0A482XKA7_LAOST|nr:hypothetical protein LSTR_LSTR017269 [Laodelphax striatellus]